MAGILITGAANTEAYRLSRLIDASQVIFADHQELPNFSKSSNQFVKISSGKAPSFAHELLTVCLDLGVDTVFALYKDEVMALSEANVLFEEFGIKLMIPSVEWLSRNLDPQAYASKNNLVVLDNGNIIGGSLSEILWPKENLTGVFNWTCENNFYRFTLFTIANVDIR